MRRALLTAAALLALSCGAPGEYHSNDLQLAPGYGAKEMCSCLFVMEQAEAFCRAWTVASPPVARFRIDWAKKAVESSALMLWGARAHFVSVRAGCILE